MIRIVNGGFELPISEVFEIDGTLVRVVRDGLDSSFSCKECFFYKKDCKRMWCESENRLDRRDVHFEVVKEGGEE